MQPPSEPKTDSLQADQQPASPPDPMATTGSLEPAKVAALLADLDLNDSHSVLFFGSAAQEQLTTVSDSMLERVRTKDVGPAGEALNDMVLTLRGFDLSGLDPNRKGGWFDRLLGKGRDAAKVLQRYENVRDQIEDITGRLERHKTGLLVDIESLDRLYAANLDYFHSLEHYIAAGEEKLRELDEHVIPQQASVVAEGDDTLAAQHLRDLRAVRDDLERRVQDLRLPRQVAMQSLPSIRLVQENDKGLVNKIISTTANTLPLWRQQLAQAVTIHRSREAAGTIRAASDLTNELLTANAENLKQGNVDARKEIERGVFDIEAVKKANAALIETIEDSLRIAEEGRQKRAEAATQLEHLETELRETLISASARANTGGATTGD